MATVEQIRSSEQRRRDWDAEQRQRRGDPAPVNVGQSERMASNLGGGMLLAVGLTKRGLTGLTLAGVGAALLYRGLTGHCSLYAALGADTAQGEGSATAYGVKSGAGVRVEEAITINRSPQALYDYWRDHANLPRFMPYITAVTSPDGTHSHWTLETPVGAEIRWEAEILTDEPGRLISWASTGGQMATAGSVRFTAAPGDRGTEVRLNQKYDPPGGKLGAGLASLVGLGPESLSRETLRNLKRLMEAGELPTVAGQPSGRLARRG